MNFRLFFSTFWEERAQDLRDPRDDEKLCEKYRELKHWYEIRSEKDL